MCLTKSLLGSGNSIGRRLGGRSHGAPAAWLAADGELRPGSTAGITKKIGSTNVSETVLRNIDSWSLGDEGSWPRGGLLISGTRPEASVVPRLSMLPLRLRSTARNLSCSSRSWMLPLRPRTAAQNASCSSRSSMLLLLQSRSTDSNRGACSL
jgi:hypothetical protein